MALVSIVGGLWIPRPFTNAATAPAFGAGMTIDAAAEKAAYIIEIPRTGTLDKFEFRAGTVSIAAGSAVRCSFQDVSAANGDPDGTQDEFRDIAGSAFASNTWMVPGLLTSDGTDTGTKRSVTAGDLVACVIEYQTFTAADSVIASTIAGTNQADMTNRPYMDLFTAAWAKQSSTYPCVALKYNDGSYEFVGGYPFSAITTTAFNTGSTPDERVLKFKFPAPVSVGGAWMRVAGGGDFDCVLYDSDGTTPLVTRSSDKDQKPASGNAGNFMFQWPDVDLSATVDYFLSCKPTSGTNVTYYDFDVNAAAIMDALEGGQNFRFTSKTDGGSPAAETATTRPFCGLLVTRIHDGAGTGGSGGGSIFASQGGVLV